MAQLFKRGKTYHFDFRFKGQRFQGSTYCKNKEAAESFVAAYRTNLAHGLVGLTAKDPAPLLKTFLEGSFLENVRQNAKAPLTRIRYEQGVARLLEFVEFQTIRLDAVTELAVQAYKNYRLAKRLPELPAGAGIDASHSATRNGAMQPNGMPALLTRRKRGLSPATINGELRTLRKALCFADRCGLIRYQEVKMLPGERNREFILDAETERRYLELAEYPLKQVAILMLDLGLRPEEAVSLEKCRVSTDAVIVNAGKTRNAVRTLPLTARSRTALDLCNALFPSSEWVFPSRKGKHLQPGSISKLHIELRNKHGLPKEFILYSCRHTFASRLAESCNGDPFVLMKALGHSKVEMVRRYVHPSADYLSLAFKRKEAFDKALRGEEVHEDTPAEKSKTS